MYTYLYWVRSVKMAADYRSTFLIRCFFVQFIAQNRRDGIQII